MALDPYLGPAYVVEALGWRDAAEPYITAADLLLDAGVRLIGTDAPSMDPFGSRDLPVHHRLRERGVANLENLSLDGVPEGRYELIALPLRLLGADGSPVRAVLRAE